MYTGPWVWSPALHKMDMVAQTCNPSSWEGEAEESEAGDHLPLGRVPEGSRHGTVVKLPQNINWCRIDPGQGRTSNLKAPLVGVLHWTSLSSVQAPELRLSSRQQLVIFVHSRGWAWPSSCAFI